MRVLLLSLGTAVSFTLVNAQDCQPSYTVCEPEGASETSLPPVGEELAPLYENFLSSIHGIHAKRDLFGSGPQVLAQPVKRQSDSFCCAENTNCLNLENFNVPFCYDRFTTNVALPDGTTGSLDDGELSIDGTTVNMQNGEYEGGNIYGDGTPPDTNALEIPSPYTSAGVGSAIPLSGLAGVVTYTTTIPGTTVAPSTIPGGVETLTLSPGTNSVAGTTIVVTDPTPVVTVTTQAPTTIAGTTRGPQTETIVSSIPASEDPSDSDNAAAPTHFAGAGLAGAAIVALAIL